MGLRGGLEPRSCLYSNSPRPSDVRWLLLALIIRRTFIWKTLGGESKWIRCSIKRYDYLSLFWSLFVSLFLAVSPAPHFHFWLYNTRRTVGFGWKIYSREWGWGSPKKIEPRLPRTCCAMMPPGKQPPQQRGQLCCAPPACPGVILASPRPHFT